MQQKFSPKGWLLIGLLALIWGGSFPATRLVVQDVPVLTAVAFRVSGGAICLWVWVLWRGLRPTGGWRGLGRFLVMGLLNNVIPFGLIVWGQQHIASGLAAILNSSTAIFTVGLAALILPDERLTARKALGVLLGILGVTLVIGPAVLASFDVTSLGQLAILGAGFSYASASIFARLTLRTEPPEVAAAGMLTAATLVMVPLALWHDGVPALHYGAPTWAALAYLATAATALAYLIFYAALQVAGAVNVSLVTMMIPPVSVLLGRLLFSESLSPLTLAGFVTLAAGLVVIDGRLGDLWRGARKESA
jgi:drug/metabolite transporter (DMT)-like permease